MTEINQTIAGKAVQTMSPIDFVKKVGKGKTLAQSLTFAESQFAFNALLDGAFTPAQTGAFLQALRIQELSQAELNGLAQVFADRMDKQPPLEGTVSLVLNMASDTARKGGLVSLLAAQLLSHFKVAVGVVRSAPVLSKNNVSFENSWKLAQNLLGQAPKLVSSNSLVRGLASLDVLRGELGFRSCLHTAEKLINPWVNSPLLLGISHKHYALRMAATMQARGLTGKIILGNHGTVDLVLHKETEIISVDANGIHEDKASPLELGLEISSDIYAVNKFPMWDTWLSKSNSQQMSEDNSLLKAVQYHISVFLWAAGVARNTQEGLALTKQTLPKFF